MDKKIQATNEVFYGESLWRLSFEQGTMQLVVRAYTAGQARRKLKAVIRQMRDGKKTIATLEGLYGTSLKDLLEPKGPITLYGPTFDGSGTQKYTSLDHLVDVAFLTREPLKDVFFIS